MGKIRSKVWDHFKKSRDIRGKVCQKCKYCSDLLYSSESAVRMRTHLLKGCKGYVPHGVKHILQIEEDKRVRTNSSQLDEEMSSGNGKINFIKSVFLMIIY
jgi:hypothetical protein